MAECCVMRVCVYVCADVFMYVMCVCMYVCLRVYARMICVVVCACNVSMCVVFC